MKNSDIKDPLFLQAVTAIDTGNISVLKELLYKNPTLIHKPLDFPEEGYFKNPYLLFFIADNPIRNKKLAANIVDVARVLVEHAKETGADNLQYQLDYTLGLVDTGSVPREAGVQIMLMDLLIDHGATPGSGVGALAHHNIEAAKHLIKRGGKLTLAVAVCLDFTDEIPDLVKTAGPEDRLMALIAAAYYGNADKVNFLLSIGADPNGYLKKDSGFHSHATALHQAVYSGSIESVKALTKAGARLDLTDRAFNGTPLGWAYYMQTEDGVDLELKKKYMAIEEYLKTLKG
jgi:peptide-methionine (S)-S-oxide reductase